MTLVGLLLLLLTALGLGASAPAPESVPVQIAVVRAVYPHDPAAFTQGLFFRDGFLYESTGLEGRSSLRKVRLEDGKVLQMAMIAPNQFGEGSTDWGDEIVSITWLNGIGYRWDRATLTQTGRFRYSGEGWGLTQDGKRLILSDGTPWLRFLDPATFAETGRIEVTADGQPVAALNELEWVKGEIFANVWHSNRIARIDPATGKVTAWIDLSGLDPGSTARDEEDVPNGIAYDARRDRLFVTGKRWPRLFEIAINP